jgi:hypothetical protein
MKNRNYDSVIRIVQSVVDPRVLFKVYQYRDHCILPSGYTLLIDSTEGALARIDYTVLDNLSPLEVQEKLNLTEQQKSEIMHHGQSIIERGIYCIDNVNVIL